MFGLLTKNQNYDNGGSLNSCWVPDYNKEDVDHGDIGWDTRRKFLFFKMRS